MKSNRLLSLLLVLLLSGLLPLTGLAGAPAADPTLPADWKPFDQRVKITVPVYDRSKEGYPAVDDNYWTRWVQAEFGEKWNVDVEYVAIPRGDVMTKYSLLIAGGDTPTIMMEYDYPKVAQWASDGAMQVIDLDAFKAVAPTYYQIMANNNTLSYSVINGENYFVLSDRAYYDTDYTFATFVRMDWLRQAGYDHVPETYTEKRDALGKIISLGLTDTAPIGLGIPSTAYTQNFGFRDIPVDEKEWVMHSSLGTASIGWEPTKAFLKRFNDEYHAGWYSTEFELEKDSKGAGADQMKTDFINGKLYSYSGYMGANVDWLTAFYEKNPGAELAVDNLYSAFESKDLAQSRSGNPFGMIVGFSSYATPEQLKAAWMLMEWMAQPEVLFVLENGIEGITYVKGEDGRPLVKGDYRGEEMLNHNMNIDMVCLVHAVKVQGSIEQSIAAITPQGLPQDFYQGLLDNYGRLREVADAGRSYTDPIFAVAIQSESEYTATLLSLYQEYFALLVKCDPAEFDALYAELTAKYLEAGYQEIIDERLQAYENGMTTKLPVR